MSILLRNYIRSLLNEIATSKRVPGNKAWEEYQDFRKFRDEKPEGMHGFPLYNRRGREGKKWFNKHADQNWLNGPIENVIALHNPVAFSYRAYHDQAQCARDIIRQYHPGTINNNEMSAYGLINLDAGKVSTDDYLRNMLPKLNPDALGSAANKRMFLHFSPRRITHAAIDDSSTTTYRYYPKVKPTGLDIWSKLNPIEFFRKYESFIEPEDRDFLLWKAGNVEIKDMSRNNRNKFNEIKKKYQYLRTNDSYDYGKSFNTSGARKWPNAYSKAGSVKSNEDVYENEMSILDFEDYKDARKNTYLGGVSDEEYNDPDWPHVLGEIVVGNWKIHCVWVDSTSDSRWFKTKETFEKWLHGGISDSELIKKLDLSYHYEGKEDKYIDSGDGLQLFYRLKAFMDAGVPINWF